MVQYHLHTKRMRGHAFIYCIFQMPLPKPSVRFPIPSDYNTSFQILDLFGLSYFIGKHAIFFDGKCRRKCTITSYGGVVTKKN